MIPIKVEHFVNWARTTDNRRYSPLGFVGLLCLEGQNEKEKKHLEALLCAKCKLQIT